MCLCKQTDESISLLSNDINVGYLTVTFLSYNDYINNIIMNQKYTSETWISTYYYLSLDFDNWTQNRF